MPNVIAVEAVTNGIITAVDAAHDWPVGDHSTVGIDGTVIDTSEAYSLVYMLPGGTLDGSQAHPHEMATIPCQITHVGRVRKQAQRLADLTRAHLLTPGAVTAVGWKIIYVDQRVVGAPTFTGRDGSDDDVFQLDDLYNFQITPA